MRSRLKEGIPWVWKGRLEWGSYVFLGCILGRYFLIDFYAWTKWHFWITFLGWWKLTNRPLPSSKNPHFQNEARYTSFLVKMSFICMRMKNDFPIKGWAPTLVLKPRPRGTRKWPIGPIRTPLSSLLFLSILHNKRYFWCFVTWSITSWTRAIRCSRETCPSIRREAFRNRINQNMSKVSSL